MSNILTYNQILSTFKDIQKRHYQLNSFGTGPLEEMGTTNLIYPVLWVNPINSTLLKGENGFNVMIITVNVKVGDLVNTDLSNENDVISDTLQILQDVVKEIGKHPYYIKSKLQISNSVDMDLTRGKTDEDLTGWDCDIEFRLISNQDFCGLPFSGISSTSFPNV